MRNSGTVALCERAGRRRDEFQLQLHDRLASPLDRASDTHVSRIRHKMGDGRDLILSVRGTGYQFRHQPDVDQT